MMLELAFYWPPAADGVAGRRTRKNHPLMRELVEMAARL
jgi:hypothetical protein